MSVENPNKLAEEEITIEVTDEPAQSSESDGDELERYTKSVSKRINKLNAKTREAEQRAQQYEAMLAQQQNELASYRQMAVQSQQSSLQAEEDKLKAQEQQVEDIFKKAVASQDADLMSKADTLKNDIAIKKEKLRVAKSRHEAQENYQSAAQNADQGQPQPVAQTQTQPEKEPEPTQEALTWHKNNPWYGDSEDETNLEATQFAYFTHYNLINEGFEPDSEEYYEALDSRVNRVYPNLSKSVNDDTDAVEETGRQPAVQRVASAQPAGRPQTRGKKNGVQFTSGELERLRGLKPHNMSEEDWLKAVAREKQKVAQREAR